MKSREEMIEKNKIQKEKLREHQEKLKAIVPKFTIKTIEQARNPKIIEYVVDRLEDGARWDEIRCELGLKPAALDKRWGEIRRIVHDLMMPETDKIALLQSSRDVDHWIKKLEESYEDLEKKIDECRGATIVEDAYGNEKVLESMTQVGLVRCRADTLKTIIEKKNLFLENYLKIRQLEKKEKSNQGPTIVINNMIPRPTKDVKQAAIVQITANDKIINKSEDDDASSNTK